MTSATMTRPLMEDDRSLSARNCQRMRLVELVARVVDHADRAALNELHTRRLCRDAHGHQRTISDWIAWLADHASESQTIREAARDMALDRFAHMPPGLPWANGRSGPSGPDCRFYLAAFLQRARCEPDNGRDVLTLEASHESLLAGHVHRHFRWACHEARRRERRFEVRYRWHVRGGTFTLWLPRDLPPKRRRAWLASQFPHADPRVSGQQEQLQQQIHRLWIHRKLLLLEVPQGGEAGDSLPAVASASARVQAVGLAETVATEKSLMSDRLRPAISALGPTGVGALVRRIFEDLSAEHYRPAEVAAAFGLSRACLSRFAGTRWVQIDGEDLPTVPDLWRNVAGILARIPEFRDVAMQAGVWKVVDRIHSSEQRGAHER